MFCVHLHAHKMLFGIIVCIVVFFNKCSVVFFIIKSTKEIPVMSSIVELYVGLYTFRK